MPLPLQILILLGALLGLCYVVLISLFSYGWKKLGEKKYPLNTTLTVSVIIAARNEEHTIANCLSALMKQSYPENQFEVIVVDDHSEDATAEIVRNFAAQHARIRFLQLDADRLGKKQAIRTGIENSSAELIVTTDADCIMQPGWLSAMVSCKLAAAAEMVVGPVAFMEEKSIFEKMQSLEFMALIASSGGSLFFGKAIMCNGANLAYTRKAYEKAGGFDGMDNKASGDDVLLMYRINALFPGKICFLKAAEAIVQTRAKKELAGFLQQRRRWASKGFGALSSESKFTAAIVYFFSCFIFFGPLIDWLCYRGGEFYLLLTGFCLILAGIKCFIDFLLLFLSASYFKKRRYLLLFLPEQILYVFYVVVTGIAGSFGRFEWKGRKTN
jgi:cellulose synthase/poly-beta-1,6-N-acetylglucosamine synthase-like glycosyltransferase